MQSTERPARSLIAALVTLAKLRILELLQSDGELSPNERRRVIAGLFHEGVALLPFVRRYITTMALSVAMAVLGIRANSPTVVIGAMLVAPLMGPVLAIAASAVMGWRRRFFTSLALVIAASLGAVLLAFVIALVVPGASGPPSGELLARTSPNLVDLAVALAAGAAGAYGHVQRQSADALAGAAVAVALVPPLAVVGMALAAAEIELARGAGFLFLANVTGITLSGALTFVISGFVPGKPLLAAKWSTLRGIALAVLLVALPIHFGRATLIPVTEQSGIVQAALDSWPGLEHLNVEIVDVGVEVDNGVTMIDLVLTSDGPVPPARELATSLADELGGTIDLRLQVLDTDVQRALIVDR
ncbi:MAG: DUF389 domain-containing protein [Acidimicrobiia bacterium]|nr:DUF389 domain-containing protein [Acidimicrobiia bacterium]